MKIDSQVHIYKGVCLTWNELLKVIKQETK